MADIVTKKNESENKSLMMLSVGILVVFLVLVAGVYFWVNRKSKGSLIFPAGINYTGTETTPVPQAQRPTYDYAKLGAASASEWATFTSPKGQYSFQHPKGMIPLIFPGDVNDSLTFNVSDVPAQVNLMILVENMANYDPKMSGQHENFVKNYWKYFNGLKRLNNVTEFENEKGLKGWKVSYITKGDVVTTENYFFKLGNDPNRILHVNNILPPEGQAVFTRILNSLEFKK